MNILSTLQEVYQKFGWIIIIRMLFYPVTTVFTTPVRMLQSLWNCRVFLKVNQWGRYQHFRFRAALISLFYSTRAYNLFHYGRTGYAPYLGLGNYPLSRCFHYCKASLYAYWKAGAFTVFLSMMCWWGSHFIWISTTNLYWVIFVTSLLFISTTFYANTFTLQNYNSVGWIFAPLTLYALINHNLILASLGLFLAAFGSFTVVILMNILFIVLSILDLNIYIFFAMLPANFKLLLHFYPFFTKSGSKTILNNLMKAIGITEKKVLYKRTSSKKLDLRSIYFLMLYIQFWIVYTYINGNIPLIFSLGIIIFLINNTVIRFADSQSMFMFMVTISTALVMENMNFIIIASFWLLISPIPALAYSFRLEDFMDIVPKAKPVSINPLLEKIDTFLAPVKSGKKILMAFDDPDFNYEKIYHGYRTIIEPPLYVAATRGIHILPDWWAIFDLNYEGAPEIWGRNVKSVLKNTKIWNAEYVIIYQEHESTIEKKWVLAGFEILAMLSWNEFEKDFEGSRPYPGPSPYCWLLKIPKD